MGVCKIHDSISDRLSHGILRCPQVHLVNICFYLNEAVTLLSIAHPRLPGGLCPTGIDCDTTVMPTN